MNVSKPFDKDKLSNKDTSGEVRCIWIPRKSTTFIQGLQKLNVNNEFSVSEDSYDGVPQGLIPDPLLFNFFIFFFLASCDMCNYDHSHNI